MATRIRKAQCRRVRGRWRPSTRTAKERRTNRRRSCDVEQSIGRTDTTLVPVRGAARHFLPRERKVYATLAQEQNPIITTPLDIAVPSPTTTQRRRHCCAARVSSQDAVVSAHHTTLELRQARRRRRFCSANCSAGIVFANCEKRSQDELQQRRCLSGRAEDPPRCPTCHGDDKASSIRTRGAVLVILCHPTAATREEQ